MCDERKSFVSRRVGNVLAKKEEECVLTTEGKLLLENEGKD